MQQLRLSVIVDLLQLVLVTGVVSMAILVHVPVTSVIGLSILCASAIVTRAVAKKFDRAQKWGILTAWAGTLLALFGPAFAKGVFTFDDYYCLMTGLMAAAIFATAYAGPSASPDLRWKILALVWSFISCGILLVTACLRCLMPEFYIALLLSIALLVFCRHQFNLRPWAIHLANTLILLLIAVPTVDFFLDLRSRMDKDSDPQNIYSYDTARRNPTAYARWTRYCVEQWMEASKAIYEPATDGVAHIRLRPNSRMTFFQSQVNINSLGFRGREISAEKGNAYRIVALGESTTFGVTLKATDKPWPEVLEEMIRERIHPNRPVEVINGGTPSWNLKMNVQRLTREILPLKPDMIISYHGYNGFNMIDGVLPPPAAKPPPPYEKRPLKLLADFEYALKLAAYKKRLLAQMSAVRQSARDPMDSEYARQYRNLIGIARSNHIRLALANYSMAVNTNSNPAVIEFYGATFPVVDLQIKANVVHTAIVRELTRGNPDVIPVDTQPHFDGEHDYFIDLVHLTQPGRQHIAEVMYAAIKETLQHDLSTNGPPPLK